MSYSTTFRTLCSLTCALALVLAVPYARAQEIPTVEIVVDGFAIEGENPLTAEATAAVLDPFRGSYAGIDGLLGATDALQSALNEAGYAFRRVILPPQTLSGGTVTLKIVAIEIAAVKVEGNQHFSDQNVLASVPGIRPGMAPERRSLSAALELVNQHPSKTVSVRLRESDSADAVDAVIDVEDQKPWRVFSGVNNIGSRQTGRTRATFGFQYTNLFARDHSFTASYTTSPENTDDVMQAGASYELPLYFANGKVSAFFSESDVDVGNIAGFQVSGAGRFWGVSFTRLLARHGAYAHEWTLGIQDRFFENTINFRTASTLIPVGNNVRSYPLTLSYRGKFEAPSWIGDFDASYSRNLQLGDNNNDRAYAASRTEADAEWDVLRVNANLNYFLPRDWLLRTQLNAQWTNEPLVSGEQFGLGGERSIRGLDERAVLGDSGYRLGLELWTPPIPKTLGLRFLAFVDFGMLDRHDIQPGEVDTDTVSSAGLGLRWQWLNNVSVNLDYGHTLAEGEGSFGGDDAYGVKWHFRVFVSY